MTAENAKRDQLASLRSPAREEVSPIMARLSTYMSAAAGRELPASVVKETKHHILDTVAAMVSGAQLNIVGTFGASAACGSALALDTRQMRTLIDYASQQAGAGIGAWRQDSEHVERSFMFGGMGARNGVTAAMLDRSGARQ